MIRQREEGQGQSKRIHEDGEEGEGGVEDDRDAQGSGAWVDGGHRSQERMVQTSKLHHYPSENPLCLSRLRCVFTVLLPELGGVNTLDRLTNSEVTFKDQVQYWQETVELRIQISSHPTSPHSLWLTCTCL